MGEGRAHIELRRAASHELHEVGLRLADEVQRLPELHWAEVHQGTGRAVLAFRPASLDERALVALVADAELRVGLEPGKFEERDHPGDPEPEEMLFLELLADAAGLLVGTGLRLSFFPRSRLAGALASGLSVLRSVPRLRRPIEQRFGAERTRLGLGVSIGLLQGPAQRPLNALVDLLEKGALRGELSAQRQLFESREHSLCPGPGAPPPRPVPERPAPLPRGPIEEYSDRAWAVALGGFGVSFLSTRSVQRAFGALYGGLPRPARLGREIFTARLSQLLARRQVLVLNRNALRRLDRVDCLVLQGDLMQGGAARISQVVFCQGMETESVRQAAESLFDPAAPLSIQQSDGYRLAPLGRASAPLPAAMKEDAEALAAGGELVLTLDRNGQLLALLEIRIRSRMGLEELVQAAHDASMRVVVASDDPEVLQTIPADDTVGSGEALFRGVRTLQREGRVVCVVAQGDTRALDIADLSISVVSPGSQVPWSAHVLCRDDLTDVRLLLEASRTAVDVGRQSVNLALGAASLGALVSVGGLLTMTSARVWTVVNLASLASMGNGLRLAADFRRRPLPPARDPTPFHAMDARGVMTRLGSGLQGLSPADALARSRGIDHKKSPVAELATAISDELFSPLVPLLAAGAGLSAIAGSVADSAMVATVVAAGAVFGGVSKYRTERAISELAQAQNHPVLVRRAGRTEQINSEQLVKGDLILLASGETVPADCRLVEANGLEVDASSLTGESLPVAKGTTANFSEDVADRSSMLYAGTSIASGKATAVVVATGAETEARRGAAAFRAPDRGSGVEARMRQLMDLTAPIAMAAGVSVVGAGLLRGRKMDEVVGSAVSLAVASVPEGLPLLAIAAQLAAARRLRVHGALVRNVRCLEAVGRVDTICFDKTGTITEGAIVLGVVSDGQSAQPAHALSPHHESVLAAALRATPPRPGNLRRADPVDNSLWQAGMAQKVTSQGDRPGWKRTAEIPFSAGRGYAAVLGDGAEQSLLSLKGAPEVLLPLCSQQQVVGDADPAPARLALTASDRKRLEQHVQELASQGLRVLAVVERDVEKELELAHDLVQNLCFLGLVAFRDPVRPTAARALADLKKAGLLPKMITGDHPSTARAIFAELSISDDPEVVTGSELSSWDEDQLADRVQNIDVFARVTPSQKVRVVRALGKCGRTVMMVGDGANDASAIRLAAVGVAMGQHSAEAARNAADIVISDARVETLLQAVVEGRALWEAVRDAVSILVGGNLGEIGFTLLAGLVSGRPPLSPRQLLLVNLFTDVAPATAVALRAPQDQEIKTVAELGPDASMGWRLDRDILARALTTASGAGLAWALTRPMSDRRGASTTALLALVGSQLGQTLTRGHGNRDVVLTNALSALGLALIVQTPGVSGAFGCRPLGPIGWGVAVSSSVAATLAGALAPDVIERLLASANGSENWLAQILDNESAPVLPSAQTS